VHFNAGDFHCGGFYSHTNNDKTTFVVAPEQAIHTGCGITDYVTVAQGTNPTPTPFPLIQINAFVNFNPWHQIQYNFCITDCDDTPLNNNINNPNCGNQ